jgi:two-component system chemotaxis response regulator CheY
MLAFTLSSAGYKVVEAVHGKEAVAKLADGMKPDLVMTDLNIPEMDAVSLIEEIRKTPTLRFTPILMLATESGSDKRKAGQAAGATGWILKPFNPEQMLRVIKKVLPG